MAPTTLPSLLVLASAAIASAASPGTVGMKLQRSSASSHSLTKRASNASAHDVSLLNQRYHGQYTVDVQVGTPPQNVTLQLDTGSSDVWMFTPQACAAINCTEGGNIPSVFDANKSSTYDFLTEGFQITYVTPGSGVNGSYFRDTFQVGDVKLKNLIMAEAESAAAIYNGIMGVSFTGGEAIESQTGKTYPSVIDTMVTQGAIDSHTYSLWLDDYAQNEGKILFGGYDSAKYDGPLYILDLYPNAQSGEITSFNVLFNMLAITNKNGTTAVGPSKFALAADLDSGTTLTQFPQSIFEPLAEYFGVIQYESGYLIDCDVANWEGTLDYQFGGANGPIIRVPFEEIVLAVGNDTFQQGFYPDGSPQCAFGISPTIDPDFILFGDTFLRSAYVIYDLEADQLAIAQANWDTSNSNVKTIPRHTDLADVISSASSISQSSLYYPSTASSAASSSAPTSYTAPPKPTATYGAAISGVATSLSLTSIDTISRSDLTTATAEASPTGASGSRAASGTGSAAVLSRQVPGGQAFVYVFGTFIAAIAGGMMLL